MTAGAAWDAGVAGVPCIGETVSGDLALLAETAGAWTALLVDVSGHGERAHALCHRLHVLELLAGEPNLVRILERVHAELQGTVGAAAMAAQVVWLGTTAALRYAGVGNVRIWGHQRVAFADEGQPGLLGSGMPGTLRVTERPLEVGDRLVLVTDGVRSEGRKALQQPYPDARQLAAVMVHGHAGTHDDATCVALQVRRRA